MRADPQRRAIDVEIVTRAIRQRGGEAPAGWQSRRARLFYESVVNDPGETVHSAEGPFWCAVTQSLIGPDGKFADTEACRAGRGRGCCQTA